MCGVFDTASLDVFDTASLDVFDTASLDMNNLLGIGEAVRGKGGAAWHSVPRLQ